MGLSDLRFCQPPCFRFTRIPRFGFRRRIGRFGREIPGTPGVHGIAIAPDLNRGFTSNGQDNTVTVFDLRTLQTIGTAQTGGHPDAIIYDPFSGRVFTMNASGVSATAIDAQTGQTLASIPLPGRPEFAVADGKGMVFANINDKHALAVIDSQLLAVKGTWDMPGCEGPSGLSMDRVNRRIFAGCDNKVMAITDADSGKQIALVPIGAGVDATTFDPNTRLVFSPNGEDGTLTVIHEDSPDSFSVAETVSTEVGARTMALDEDTGTVYLVTASGKVRLILGFILGVFRSFLRPAIGIIAFLFFLLAAMIGFRARARLWPLNLVRWSWTLAIVGMVFATICVAYDPIVLALSPADFHMTIWRPTASQAQQSRDGSASPNLLTGDQKRPVPGASSRSPCAV